MAEEERTVDQKQNFKWGKEQMSSVREGKVSIKSRFFGKVYNKEELREGKWEQNVKVK